MKHLFYLVLAVCMCFSTSAEAQLLGKLKAKAEEAAERAVIKKTEQKVTKETENSMDKVLGEKAEKSESVNENRSNTSSKVPDDVTTAENSGGAETKIWSKYNFVPGDEIIFEDDLSTEENGEFPSRWDLLKGNAENATLNGEPIIKIDKGSYITPLMKKEKYLPEVFTLEFDAYFNDVYHTYQQYNVLFFPGTVGSAKIKGGHLYPLKITMNGAWIQKQEEGSGEYKTFENYLASSGKLPGWKHVAISYNKGNLKVFLDEDRILNIPNIDIDPGVLSIQGYTIGDNITSAIKNIRIAEGGKKLYDRVVADGKFVTRGILFDVNKASLKPESMGVLNEIAALMKEHKDLKFRIEGHTDSDGDENSNLQLSEKRALTVKETLASLGIEGSRLQSKGMGETVPLSENTTAEGKANNRRVEFVKI